MEAVWLGLAGIVVYLDTTAVAQLMICQPIIACPAWGWITGKPELGLLFGVMFQLVWLGSLPVGAAKFPEGNVGALVATGLATGLSPAPSGELPWAGMAIAVAVGILTARLGAEVTALVRRIQYRFSEQFLRAALERKRGRLRIVFMEALGVHAAAGFLLTMAMYFAGRALLAALGDEVLHAYTQRWSGLWPAMLGAGVAVMGSRFVRRETFVWFIGGAVLALGAGVLCL